MTSGVPLLTRPLRHRGSPGSYYGPGWSENRLPRWSRGSRGQGHGVAQSFQTMHEATFDSLPVSLIEVVAAQVAVVRPPRQQGVGNDQDGGGTRARGLRSAATRGEPPILGRQIGALGASRSMRGLDQARSQPGASL